MGVFALPSEPKLSRDGLIAQARARLEAMLGRGTDAIGDAPPGRIISGSEEQVRDLQTRKEGPRPRAWSDPTWYKGGHPGCRPRAACRRSG
jgi:hypothetical protein